MRNLGIHIFFLIWCVVTVLIDAKTAPELLAKWKSRQFVSISGKIVDWSFRLDSGRPTSAEFKFSYTVDGKAYTQRDAHMRSTESVDYANKHPLGTIVDVYYNPTDPQESLLRPGIDSGDMYCLLLMISSNCVVVGILRGWISWLRVKLSNPVAGGIPIITTDQITRARLCFMSTVDTLLYIAGPLALLTLMLPYSMSHDNPSTVLTTGVWTLFISALIIGPIIAHRRDLSGKWDVVIDHANQKLTLPLAPKQIFQAQVPISEIHRVALQYSQLAFRRYPFVSYAVEVHLKDGQAICVTRFWYFKWMARPLAEWLNQQLHLRVPIHEYQSAMGIGRDGKMVVTPLE